MKFRVDKTLSVSQLEKHFLEHAKAYCAEVLQSGAMSSPALGKQRTMMMYHEALVEKMTVKTPPILPGQLSFFDMDEENPKGCSVDYPESKESFEGIYQHRCSNCGHLFFGWKRRTGEVCYKCHRENFS